MSLGAALLQNPELLILDEPTVGVDPVLRAKYVNTHIPIVVISGQACLLTLTPQWMFGNLRLITHMQDACVTLSIPVVPVGSDL